MKIFDLHCDTIGECYKQNKMLKNNDLHFSLDRCKSYDFVTQVFAVWIPDELRGKEAVSYFNNVSDYFYNQISCNADLVSMYNSAAVTPVKAILSLEGASGCGGTIDGLYNAYEKGVRIVTLTWNGNNEIGAGAFSEGGLTSFGRDFIKACDEVGVVIDVSHLNRQTFKDVLSCTQGPVIATHSNADIIDNFYARHRNLSEYQIKAIKERGGIIGLNFCADFIENNKKGTDALAQQMEYFLSVDCENVVALGSDYDGCEMHKDFCGVEKLEGVYCKLINMGFSSDMVNKMFYDNAQNFWHNKKSLVL